MSSAPPEHASLAGQLLLALPGMGDRRFAQAVIAICLHGPDGAFGLGVGRIVPRLGLHGLMAQLDIAPGAAPDASIHLGGPVEPQRGFVLHSRDWEGADTVTVSESLGLTTTLDVLRALADGAGPARWLVALGYAGWGAGQLDEELCGHAWFSVPTREALLFDVPVAERWPQAFASAGVDVRLMASVAGRA